jgi:hypothetical protein
MNKERNNQYSVFGTDDYEDRQLMYEGMTHGRKERNFSFRDRLLDSEGAGHSVDGYIDFDDDDFEDFISELAETE